MIAHRPPLGRSFNPWHFTWIAAVVSEVFTVIITSIQYYFDPTMNLHNLLRVGAIDALFVPLIVVPIVIYFSRNELALRQINVQLEKEIAERNRAETALGSAEEKYRNLIETTDTGFVIIDGHGRVEDANGKYAELCGRKEPADVIGRSVLDWTAPYDQARNTVEVKKCVERGFVRDFEVDYIAPNGKITPVEINATVLRSGDSVTILNLCRDITERKRAEEALREHQEQLDMALQSAHMGVWRHEIKEERHYFDKVTCQILGIDASIFSGKSEDFFKVIHPEDREKVKATIGQTIAQNVPLKIIFRVVWPEGSLHYISSRGRLVCDDAGQPQRLNGILWDVTERLTSEIELQEKETKYRLLFESAKDGIFIVSENGFVDCNQRGAEMYGLTREDVLRRSHLDLAPGRQPDGRLSGDVSAEKMRLVMSGIPQVFEWQSLHSSGQPFDVEITLNKLELGGRMYVQAIVRDISERKRLEHERIRTQKLESIGTLAGGIAHDFNNMLQGVFGYISLAKLKRDDQAKSIAALEEAEKALHMTVKLTNQLLTFSRGGKPVKKIIDVRPVVENAAKFALSGSRTDFRIAADNNLWKIDADEGQVSQVIQNIVLNADQAMPEAGRVEITLSNIQAPAPDLPTDLTKGEYIEISIKDTGIGIPKKYLHRIFDPYFTTKDKGSGLGLATSYSIIKNHNGEIKVESELEKGTTFRIYLPAEITQEAEKQPAPLTEVSRKTGRVLVMDDEEFILNIAGELLNALGHDVDFAKSGAEAIDKYQEAKKQGKPFDIAILDMTIRGGMGGADTLKKLLELDPMTKAVVSSGYSVDAGTATYEKQGFKAVLRKPYNIDDLQNVLNRLLG